MEKNIRDKKMIKLKDILNETVKPGDVYKDSGVIY